MSDGRALAFIVGAGATAALLYLALRQRVSTAAVSQSPREEKPPLPLPSGAHYTTETWKPLLVEPASKAGIPISFVMNWLKEESGGNPCAIGAPGELGPDGNPRELGIAQLYNPDDLKRLGVTGTELRAYCMAGKFPVQYKGRSVMSHSQGVARPLAQAEMQQQALTLIRKIVEARDVAERYATAAKVTWSRTGTDFWRLVKLDHGLPGLVKSLVTASKQLGPPDSWRDFRKQVESGAVALNDPNTEAYRSEFGRVFDNAEHAAAGVT